MFTTARANRAPLQAQCDSEPPTRVRKLFKNWSQAEKAEAVQEDLQQFGLLVGFCYPQTLWEGIASFLNTTVFSSHHYTWVCRPVSASLAPQEKKVLWFERHFLLWWTVRALGVLIFALLLPRSPLRHLNLHWCVWANLHSVSKHYILIEIGAIILSQRANEDLSKYAGITGCIFKDSEGVPVSRCVRALNKYTIICLCKAWLS